MDGILIFLLVFLAICIIGCIIRSANHHKTENKFDLPSTSLISTEIEKEHYIIYFDASKFPNHSDDAWNDNHFYSLKVVFNKTGRVNKNDLIATVKIIKTTSGATPSTGSYNYEHTFKEYQVHSPYNGVVSPRYSSKYPMAKFVVCELKPGTEQDENAAINDAIFKKYGISEQYFNDMKSVCQKISEFKESISINLSVIEAISKVFAWPNDDHKEHITHIIMTDGLRCLEGLGEAVALDSKEGFGLTALSWGLMCDNGFPEYRNLERFQQTTSSMINYIQMVKSFAAKNFNADGLVLPEILAQCDSNLLDKYMVLLHQWALTVAKADGKITEQEETWLKEMTVVHNEPPRSWSLHNDKPALSPVTATDDNKSVQTQTELLRMDPLKELNEMIGLDSVKEEIRTLYNFIKIQKMRENNGMKSSSVSYHCVFTGNPGTGKTTVARIVAEIYKELGILNKGHLVETDRSGLVAEYVGQTAVKTNKIIDSALDGVLFIDEAYSLSEGGQGDFGKEAIATLLKRMEDDRDRLVVILAGYSSNMKGFINTNPGLQSRFNRYINFPDYTSSELYDIFVSNVKKNDYSLSSEAEPWLRTVLDIAIINKDCNFGNGRFVRNLFEKTIQNQANRISIQEDITAADLKQIRSEDIPL